MSSDDHVMQHTVSMLGAGVRSTHCHSLFAERAQRWLNLQFMAVLAGVVLMEQLVGSEHADSNLKYEIKVPVPLVVARARAQI